MYDFVKQMHSEIGMNSYRYRGSYGYIMIAAKDINEALEKAQKRISRRKKVELSRLQIWINNEYHDIIQLKENT